MGMSGFFPSRMMLRRIQHTLILAALAAACAGEPGTTGPESPPPPPPPPPPPAVLLKEIMIPNLPAPYYHFEYDGSGRVSEASFASGYTNYAVTYEGDRITALANNTAGNHDRLEYSYDQAGRVTTVSYVDAFGQVYIEVDLSYDGARLTRLERSRKIDADFVVEKTMAFTYYADGNLMDIVEYRPMIAGRQDESTVRDRFEQYDDRINVDAFSLLHDDFFDHLVLLPGVQLQTGNPERRIRTGDGVHYTEDYTYAYDGENRPLTRNGVLVYANGPNAGQAFQTQVVFSYY
jgi:hypothetical protein